MNRHRPAKLCLASAFTAAVMLLTGCSLIVSNTRQVKRIVSFFANAIADRQYKDAASYMTKDFSYITLDDKTYGRNSAKAFFGNIDKLKHTQFFVDIQETKETNDTTVWVKARLQSRKADAVSTENHFWTVSMIWVKIEKKWKLKEVKDLTEMSASRS